MPRRPSTGGGSGLEPVLLWPPLVPCLCPCRAPSTRHEQRCSRPSSVARARELSVSKTISTVTSGAGLSPLPPHAALPMGAGCQTLLWGWGASVCTPFLCPLGLSGFLWAPLKADRREACVYVWALSRAVPLPSVVHTRGCAHGFCRVLDCLGCAVSRSCPVWSDHVKWSERHLSPVTHLVPLSVPCCWLPQALPFPVLAAAVLEPCSHCPVLPLLLLAP